ncbi:50S ribosomal protein L25 [bacterium DOLZORAL124_38_8]|nr:MAG: 50S ribosomal protein L25 [bacterium DOLZORAL124_38_8]
MTKEFTINAEKRDSAVKRSVLEDERKVPAVVYGANFESTALSLDASEILRVYRKAGTSNLVDLVIDGGKPVKVLVKDLGIHPVRHEIDHVDFYAVDMKKPTDVLVPFTFTGVAPAVKNYGAVLAISHENILLRCLPADIPATIEVDVSGLKEVQDSLSVADLNLDESKFRIMNLDSKITICAAAGRKGAAKKLKEAAAA